ncbi:MAG: putative metal-dependent hydrolase [Planctomycetota bacterium]|jgi:predicted metal-dependent hydrolase
MEQSTNDSTLLREAIRLFNDSQYYEAHEALEELWEAGYGESADFYKGLLQASIALHHFRLDNPEGARKLYSGHRRYLAPYIPAHLGVKLTEFLEDMQSFLKPVLRARAGESVPFNSEARPQIQID